MYKNDNLNTKEIFKLATQNHLENKLKAAKDLYNKVLEIDPNNFKALNNLGALYISLGDNQKAKKHYEKAIIINPLYADPHNNIGLIFAKSQDFQKAKSHFKKAIEIKPKYTSALVNLGVIYVDLKEYQNAENCFEKAIESDQNNYGAYFALANLKKSQEKIEEAKTLYLKSIEINPNFLEAQVNLGALFYSSGDNEKAESYYKRAIEINPNSSIALQNISNIYIARLDNFEKAIYSSNKALKIDIASQPIRNKISFFRLKHSVEQAKHLSSKNYQIEGLDEFQKMGDEILNRKENIQIKNIRTKKILLNAEEINNLMPFFKSDYVYQTKKISGSCINPNKNWLAVEEEYLNSSNQIIYIDNFLSDEALIELREFCLVSKVWNREYLNKYLGAFSDSGFISKIHLQIATDLKKKLPKLFGPHSLSKFWAFKYDSTLGQGINVHADFATHNLNFWITPDEFNNNKNSGGLKVYDVAAPDNWTFSDYNNNSEKIYKFLKDESANCINIPYKFNRAVLFNSSYFHETDEIDFKDEYAGRRINNTYLFGNRSIKKKIK